MKITVLDSSEDDMWFAYSTATYDARLAISFTIPTTTTTTTTIPTTSTTVSYARGNDNLESTVLHDDKRAGHHFHDLPRRARTIDNNHHAAGFGYHSDHYDVRPCHRRRERLRGPHSDRVGAPLILAGDGFQTESTSWDASGDISPQEGLMVAFTTVTENISLYWPVAVGLGLVASALLWIPMRKRQSDEETPHLEN